MIILNPRARVRKALNFEPVDRPPIDLGSTPNTSIHRIAHGNLVSYLGFDYKKLKDEIKVVSIPMQCITVPEATLERLHVDTRPVYPSFTKDIEWVSNDEYVDSWGIGWRAVRTDLGEILYYEMVDHPLKEVSSPKQVEVFNWPNSISSKRVESLSKRAQNLRENTDYALVGHPRATSIFETSWYLRSMEKFFPDLIQNKDIADVILNRVFQVRKCQMRQYLTAVGRYLDVVSIGDDLGMQSGPLISPAVYREMIKPYHKKYFQLIKSLTPAKLHMHCCGAVAPLIPDLMEIGVDIINPVQVSAEDMNPGALMEKFGGRIVFWGGIDTQQVLPNGSPEDVRTEVQRRVEQFRGIEGGYVLCSVHNIQADVPPENIVTLFDTACKFSNK